LIAEQLKIISGSWGKNLKIFESFKDFIEPPQTPCWTHRGPKTFWELQGGQSLLSLTSVPYGPCVPRCRSSAFSRV